MSTPYAERARRLRQTGDEVNEINEVNPADATGHNEGNEVNPHVTSGTELRARTEDEVRSNSLPASFETIAQHERWDMPSTVAYIRSLSDEKLAVYRAALAFDAEALRQAEADDTQAPEAAR